MILDPHLTWKEHTLELSKKLNRAVGMLYKSRHYCPTSVLKSLYYSIFNSHAAYGLPVWGYADDKYTQKIINIQKKAIRAITFSKFREHSAPLLKKLKILKFKDLLYLKTASLLWDLDKGTLPSSLSSYFTRASSTHSQNTRFAKFGNLRVDICSNSFQSIGTKIFNELNNSQSFLVANKKCFLEKIQSEHFFLFYFY